MKIKELIIENKTIDKLGPQLYVPNPENRNFSNILNENFKPHAKIWTSTAHKKNGSYSSEWVEWCISEMPHWVSDYGTLYDVSIGAKIISINSDKDAIAVAKHYGVNVNDSIELFDRMPWNKISQDYDAIHHIPTFGTFMSTWDVESTAWFNTKFLINPKKVSIS